MLVEGYKIVRVYPSISIGVNGKGEEKCFQNSYLLLDQEHRDAQNAYWDEVEAEFRHQEHKLDRIGGMRSTSPLYT